MKMMEDNLGISVQIDPINSFDHVELAQDVADNKMYDTAIELYHEGLEKAKSVSSNKFDMNWLCFITSCIIWKVLCFNWMDYCGQVSY